MFCFRLCDYFFQNLISARIFYFYFIGFLLVALITKDLEILGVIILQVIILNAAKQKLFE